MKQYKWNFIFMLMVASCQAQSPPSESTKHVGGPCEGCEAIHEYGNSQLNAVDTLPGFIDNQPKLKITGRVLLADRRTPARGVIVYIYHTNRQGIYETNGHETGWARRHGLIRGWIKTKDDGVYTFYTFRPGPYPGGSEPEHIHITVKEPDKNEYYIDEYVFDDDPLLSNSQRKKLPNRGGSGIVKPVKNNTIFVVQRDIHLGHNIPDYPN